MLRHRCKVIREEDRGELAIELENKNAKDQGGQRHRERLRKVTQEHAERLANIFKVLDGSRRRLSEKLDGLRGPIACGVEEIRCVPRGVACPLFAVNQDRPPPDFSRGPFSALLPRTKPRGWGELQAQMACL